MILMPRKFKHRKHQRGNLKGKRAKGGYYLAFGSFGLIACENGYLSSQQIEAARRAIVRHVKRGGKIWIRVFPDKVFTATPPETGMGGGKGDPDWYAAPVRRGRIIFEMDGVPEEVAQEAFRIASHKLPIKTKFIKKEEV